jgi:hypothetical protein
MICGSVRASESVTEIDNGSGKRIDQEASIA